MRKFLLATMAILWLLTSLGGKLVAQENIAVWKFPSGVTDVTCVSDRILASDCSFSSEGTVSASGTNSSNTSLCGDTDDTKSLQVTGQAGGSVIFKISAAPYSGISISYDLRGHPNMTYHGYTDYVWSYSTNGTTFTDAPAATAISGFTETTFTAQTADFSSISALNGSNEVWFKLTMSGAEGASVASNIDNVVFSGTPLTCLTPVNMTAVANDAPTQAVVSWSPAGDNEESYTLVYYTSALSNDALNSFLSVSQYASYVATNATSPHTLTNLNADTHYYVYVRANCGGDDNSLWANADVTTPAVCTISGLEATDVAGSTASLSWTTGAGSTMIRVFTAAKNNPWEATADLFLEETVNGTSYDLTGLAFSTTYHVYAKSVCSENNISETAHTSFTTNFADNVSELTVNNGTTTNEYVPIYGYYVDNISKSQFIIPALSLDDMVEGTIHQLKFYCSQSSVNFGNARFKVYIGETTATTLSSTTPNYSGMTEVYAGALSISGGMMQIDLTTPYLYNGGNLMIGVLETTSGSYSYTYWYGVSQSSNTSIGGYGSYDVSYYQFLPKTTFTYSPAVYSCPKPTNLAAGNVTATSATITWLAGGDETAWVLKYGPAGFDVETAGTEVAVETTPSYEMTGLTANTAYDVYVKAVCSDTDESAWRMVSFETPCVEIALPYSEDFESYQATGYSTAGVMPDCWTAIFTGASTGYSPHVSTSYAPDGKGIVMTSGTSNYGSDNYIIMPVVENTTNVVVEFDYKMESLSYGTLNFGYMNPANASSFVSLQQISSSTSSAHAIVNVASLADDMRFAFKWTNSYLYYSCGIDNVIVRERSSAAEITAFSFAEDAEPAVIDNENATVTCLVSYSTESLNGLVPTIAISANASIAPASGVAQDFSSPVTYTVTAEDGTTTKDWTINVSKVATASSAKDILSFSFNNQQGESVIDAENHTVLAYVAWNYDLTLATNKIAPTITVSPLARIYPVSDSAINFAAPVTYTVTAEDESTQQWTVTIQNDPNACVNPLPATFVVSDLTSSTATLAWVRRYTETSYNVKVSTTAISVSDIATTDGDVYNGVVNDTTITLTGLAENTMYYVYVQSACGVQTWVSKSFRTIITPATIPYIYAFEDATENEAWVLENGSQTNKWYIGTASSNSGNGLYISSNNGESNIYSNTSSSSVYAYRLINLEAAGEYIVAFDWKSYGESSYNGYDVLNAYLVSGLEQITAGSSPSSSWILATNNSSGLEDVTTWQHSEKTVDIATSGNYILAFFWKNDGSGGDNPPATVDNISITRIACPTVADMIVSDITTTSADITWTERGPATAWDVVFSDTTLTDAQLASATPVNVTAASYRATELTQNTPYYIYVRAHCSDEDQSDWSAAQFRTECGDLTVPFTETFNDYTATNSYTAGIMPDCWDVVYEGTSLGYSPHVCNSSSYAPNGGTDKYLSMVAYDGASVGANSIAILPSVSGGYANLSISFDTKVGSAANGTLSLGYMNNGVYTNLTEVTVASAKTSFSYVVPSTVPANAQLALKLTATGTSYMYLGVDNILVREASTDNTILSYSASTEQGDAICSVDNDAHSISVELRAGYVAGNGIRQTIVPTDPNATVKQLVGTEYITPNPYIAWHMTTSDTVFVYKVIAENGAEQPYNATITVESCGAPSALVAEQTSTTNVNCSWTPSAGTTAWNFYCSTSQLTPAALDALTTSDYTTVTTASASATVVGETTYYWYVRADCSGSYSAWLEGTFTTWENCVAPTNVTTELVGDNDVLITWNVQDNLPLAETNVSDDFERDAIAGGSFTYTNDATYPWVITTAAANAGSHSIKSGNYNVASSTSSIVITANYPTDGTLSFYGRVSSEQTSVTYDWDYGTFYIDDVQQGDRIINSTTFSHFTYNVPAGSHTFMWRYKKDGYTNTNDDCFYVDDITMNYQAPSSSVVLYKDGVELATLPATQTSYTDAGLEAGHYCYTIKTLCREGSESEFSAPVCQDINDCLAVTNLSAGSITDSSAVISWTRGTETSWNLKVNDDTPVALTETTEGVTVNGDVISYALTGLEQNTTYTVAIQSNCDGTLGQNWASVEFTTERTPATLPYVYGFEDATENANWVFANGNYTNKWYIGPAANHGGANGLYISGDNGQTNTYAESSSYVYAYREINFASAGDYIVSFDWIAVGEGSYSAWDAMYAALVPHGTACPPASDITGSTNSLPAGYINVADVSQSYITTGAFLWTYTASDWQTSTMTIPISAPGVYTLVFYWKNDSSDGENPPAAVDNINIRALTCPAVDNLAVATSGITSNSAVITWTEHGTAEAWEVIVSATEVTDFDAATKIPVTDTTYAATGLHAETTYHVYVRANCDIDDNSDWAHTTFTTLVSCPAPEDLTAPALTITNNSAVITWTERGSAEAWEVVVSSTTVTDFTTATIVPVTEATYTATGLQAETTYHVYVRANCDVDDNSQWTHATFTTVANCPVPDGLTASAITGNSATITWNGYIASNWTLEYRQGTTGTWTVVENLAAATYTITGLNALTTYNVRVKAVCEDDAESAYSSTLSFTTTCAAITEFPWNEGFENGIDCWTIVDQDGDGYEWYEASITDANAGSLSNHGGTYMMTSASYNDVALTPNNWLISPALDLSGLSGTVKMSYFIGGQDMAWYEEHYKVCVSTSTDIASFTDILFEETLPESGWLERNVDLSTYIGQTIYVAFVHYNCTDMFRLNLDDISVYVDNSTDAAITGITAPTHGDYSTCALTDAEQIKINILNNGGAAISDFEVSYSINGGTPVTETVTASVAPAQTYEYTFAQTVDLSTVGTYTITASINLTGDETDTNNSASITITSGDATVRIHALTDSYSTGGGQSWIVTNTITNEVVAERTTAWQWNIEINDYICVDASQCYSVVVNDADGMSSPAYLEILYNDVQVAGSTEPGSFTGPSLVAERFATNCQSSENDIITFSVPDMLSVDINNENHTVTAEISYASTENLSAIVPTITVSEYAEITLVDDVAYVAGNAQNFTNPVDYIVVAENGTPQTWNVTVTRSTNASSEKDIIAFTFAGQVGESVIDPTEHTVTAFASWNISLEDPITPTIVVSPMATINPASGVAQNFSAPVTYTVTAEDQSTQEWIVTITQDSSTMASLPYTCNFEDATENANWVLENGNELNNWYIGAATNHGGANGLYISDDNGASYHYNTTDGTYSDEDRGSYVYAYRQINVAETGHYDISFDWLANGEGSYDLLRAFAVPLTSGSTLVAGNANGMTSYTNTNPTGWIDIANPTGILNQRTEWQTSDTTIELNAGAYNLVFFWKNDYSGGSQTPAAVDNVSIVRSTFTITASAEGLGSITPVGDTVVADGATVVFTMTPMSGFALSALTVDGVDRLSQVVNNTYTFENVSADHTIVATFEPAIIINATAGNGGSISPAGEVSVGAHSNATFTITAGEGYIISSVLVDNEEVLNDNTVRTTYNYTFTNVTASHTIAASFVAAEPHYITANASAGGSISPSGRVEVAYNGSQTFEFTPDEGYSLANIVVDNGPATAENNTYTFTNVIADHTITANFTANSYNLTIHYVFADDSEAAPDYTESVVFGTPYSVESPVIAGYTASIDTVAGTMPADDVTVTVRYTANNYTLTIHYVYEDNTEARQDYTAQFAYGAEYSVESPVIECYTANTLVVEGTMPAEDHVVTVTYTVDTYTLTIHYVYADNTAISDSVMQVACGTTYSVESPVIDGYTANPAVVEGTMPAENHEVTVTYNEIVTHTLTIHYVYAETGEPVVADYTGTFAEGAAYSVPSPEIDGYTADQTVVAGTMGTADITVTVTYTENAPVTHTLTIHYVYAETNAQAAADYTATLAAGESYSVASPVIAGYTADQATVAGTMPAQDVVVTVRYTANPVNTYTITATAGNGGTINPLGTVTVNEGGDQAFTITADAGYRIASVLVDGADAISELVNNVYTFVNVTANHTIAVTFAPVSSTTYTIIATAGANGTITPNGVITVNEGATQTFRITPNNGYRIATVMVDDVNVIDDVVDFEYTFYNVTADHRINVTFTNGDAVDEYTAGSMSVYPNPNNGMFSIEFANINGDATYQLIDARGAVVETRDINVMNGDTMNFDYNLRPGAYFVRIITTDRVYVEQIVVE